MSVLIQLLFSLSHLDAAQMGHAEKGECSRTAQRSANHSLRASVLCNYAMG